VLRPTPLTSLRPLALALTCVVMAGASASAQTVIVTHAPASGSVELVFNSDHVAAATADANGEATMTFALPVDKSEADVRVSTERCGDVRRVLLVERGLPPPPPAGACDRRDITGFFIVRRETTFVIDVTNPDPIVHLRQGPAPLSWLGRPGTPEHEGINLPPAPSGVYVFGDVGLVNAMNASTVTCGNATSCTAGDLTGIASVGAGYWVTKMFGVQASYMHPAGMKDSGTGDGYTFTSTRTTDLFTITGTVGAPVGGLRIYGRGGVDYQRTTLTTSDTITASGTQNFELKTAGWGWIGAGGIEVWLKPWLAVHVDAGVAKLKGSALGGVEGSIDDELVFATVGARIRLGR